MMHSVIMMFETSTSETSMNDNAYMTDVCLDQRKSDDALAAVEKITLCVLAGMGFSPEFSSSGVQM